MMRYTWVILAGLVVPASTVGQAPDTTRADVVSLAFSWPVGMRASIDL